MSYQLTKRWIKNEQKVATLLLVSLLLFVASFFVPSPFNGLLWLAAIVLQIVSFVQEITLDTKTNKLKKSIDKKWQKDIVKEIAKEKIANSQQPQFKIESIKDEKILKQLSGLSENDKKEIEEKIQKKLKKKLGKTALSQSV